MISPHSIKRFAGLFGSSNPNRPPEGASELEQDVVHRSLDVVESRRGFKASASVGAPINAIAFKQGKLLAMTYDTPSNAGALNLYDPALNSWSAMPMTPGGLTIDRPAIAGAHTRFVSAQKAIYFQSRYGLTKVEDIAKGVCRAAILPKPIVGWSTADGWVGIAVSSVSNAGGNNWLLNGNNTAYRITLARKGANGELIESEPSDRFTMNNQFGTSQTPTPRIFNGWMVPPDAFYRLYRSNLQVPVGTSPTEEMYLVSEQIAKTALDSVDASGYLTKVFIVANATYLDQSGDTSLYVPLYTNPQTGLGMQQANTPALLSGDMVWFRNRMHHFNTSDVQRVTVKVIGTGVGGINAGDWISINGQQFNFSPGASLVGPYNVLTPVFTLQPTVAQNLDFTARGLVAAINARFSAGGIPGSVIAHYLSSTNFDAGQILLQSVVPGDVPFTVQTSSSSGWDRDYTASTKSDPNPQASGWSWSAFGQPEASPTANNNPIGDPTAASTRAIALKETLFVFRQDGLWRITDDGTTVGPFVQLVDPTIRLIAPETAVAVDNMIFALCDQGVVRITENGSVENISHLTIERELFKLAGTVGFAKLAELSFAVANLPEHSYILCVPESATATSCTRQYVYSVRSQAWTAWNIPGGVLSGALHPDTDQLYFGRADGTLCIERNDYANSDFQDPGFTIASPTAALTANLVFAGDLRTGATPFAVGDLVQQWQALKALSQRVVGVTYSSAANQTTVTLDAAPKTAWNQAVNLTIIKAIQSSMKLLPITAGEPLTDKDWGDSYLHFRYLDLDFLSVGWASEKVPLTNTAVERVNNADGSAAPLQLQPWGATPWGSNIWGRQAKDVVLKCTVPQDFGYSSQLTLTLGLPCALSRFELSSIDVKITGVTDKVVR